MKKILITSFGISIAIMLIASLIINSLSNRATGGEALDVRNDIYAPPHDTVLVSSRSSFFLYEFNIRNYIEYITTRENEILEGLNDTNLLEIKKNIQELGNVTYIAKEIYSCPVGETFQKSITFVSGVFRGEATETEYYFAMRRDFDHNTFSIEKLSKEDYENAKNNQVRKEYMEEFTIEPNVYNEVKFIEVTDMEMLNRYLADYQFYLKTDVEKSFELVNSEYKKVKFNDNIESYKEYIRDNRNSLLNISISNQKFISKAGDTTYIFVDQNHHYYKIQDTLECTYTITLDNTTLEQDQFTIE